MGSLATAPPSTMPTAAQHHRLPPQHQQLCITTISLDPPCSCAPLQNLLSPSLPSIPWHAAAATDSGFSPPHDITATHHLIGWQLLVPWSKMPRTNKAWGKRPAQRAGSCWLGGHWPWRIAGGGPASGVVSQLLRRKASCEWAEAGD